MYPQRSVMTCGLATALEPPHFNHAPVRGAIGAIQYVAGYVTKFQSTHPRGVRRALERGSPSCAASFNPRTRVGCDQAPPGPPDRRSRFQSTHPRGVRLVAQGKGHVLGHVSIHAPAWGATSSKRCTNPVNSVSIHAPAWGATVIAAAVFNDTARVSIHAPAWGATPCKARPSQCHLCFNPRTRVGCDKYRESGKLDDLKFQSTHPRGVRLVFIRLAYS